MNREVQALVVGGGIYGVSAALHLAQRGVQVELLERDEVFSGTTGSGGGFVAPWSVLNPLHGADSIAAPLERYAMQFYKSFAEAGHDIAYRENGVMWVAASAEAWDLTQRMAWPAADPQHRRLAPHDLPGFTDGLLSAEGVHGAQFIPSGCQVHTPKLRSAIVNEIEQAGGRVRPHTPVTALRVDGGRVIGVDTPHGSIDAPTVVVAAGAWTAALISQVGYFLPAVPQVTSRITTGPREIPSTTPIMMLQGLQPEQPGGGTVLWVRSHGDGLVWGGMYLVPPRNDLVDRAVPSRFDELDHGGVLENEAAARRAGFFPRLAQQSNGYAIRHGVPCYTADDMALVGPVPGVSGLHVMGGDNELGVTHGPGLGRALAELITTGSSDLIELAHWDPARFGSRFSTQQQVLDVMVEQFGEVLAGNY